LIGRSLRTVRPSLVAINGSCAFCAKATGVSPGAREERKGIGSPKTVAAAVVPARKERRPIAVSFVTEVQTSQMEMHENLGVRQFHVAVPVLKRN
jgi:hypothetical protein